MVPHTFQTTMANPSVPFFFLFLFSASFPFFHLFGEGRMLLRNPSSSSAPCLSPSSSIETLSPQLSTPRSISQHHSSSPISSTLGFVSPSLVPQRSSYSPASTLTTATSASAASPSDTPQNSSSFRPRQAHKASSTSSFFLQETRQGDSPSSTACRAYKLTYGGEEAGEKEGRVALVTGASRGIGKAIADALAEGGVSHLLCVARQQAACDEAAEDLKRRGFSASGHAVDVADPKAVETLCNELFQQYPHIDILVNNAGITRDNIFLRMTEENWTDVINTNLNSAFYFSSHILKRMVKNKFGRIINISSVVGVGGNPGQANYSASKAGLIGLTRTLGKEYANRNITVNAIAPGFIRSAMTDKMTEEAK
ncbi:3-ketoacyl-(acyl-carrier-protein) reductase, partial [Cystoisospora suis]